MAEIVIIMGGIVVIIISLIVYLVKHENCPCGEYRRSVQSARDIEEQAEKLGDHT